MILNEDEIWYIRMLNSSIGCALTEVRIEEVTEKTVLIRQVCTTTSYYTANRYKTTDIEFVERKNGQL